MTTIDPSLPEANQPKTKLARVLRVTERLLAIFGLFTLLTMPFFQVTDVVSDSMAPTLEGSDVAGDVLLIENLSYYFRAPRRHDIVYFSRSDGISRVAITKRVMAVPGESVEIKQGKVEVDGKVVSHPDIAKTRYFPGGKVKRSKTYKVSGGVFVLGDNQRESWDSRFFGEIKDRELRGRVAAILWPPSRWRFF